MSERRGRTALRGSIPKGTRGASKPRPELAEPEDVRNPAAPRRVVDHVLSRQRALYSLFNGGALSSEFCDADPYLLKAAKNHGEEAPGPCPVCKSPDFVNLTYVYGDELGPYSGRIRATDELAAMAIKFGSFNVYVVEVCGRCSWNFLITTYVLGDGVPRRALPTPRDLLD